MPKKTIVPAYGVMAVSDASGFMMTTRSFSRAVLRGSPPAALLTAVMAGLFGIGAASVTADDGVLGSDDRRYAVAEALFLQRNNAATPETIVVRSTAPDVPVLTAGDPAYAMGTGMRLLYGDHGRAGLGWEVGYLGVFGMNADRLVADPAANLQAAGDLGFATSGLNDGELAEAALASTLNSAEANVVFHSFGGGPDRGSPYPWQRSPGYAGGHVDWLVGFRWAGLDETAVLGITPAGFPTANTYSIQATSNLFATQAGVRGRVAWERWAFEGFAKVGFAGTALHQSQTLFDQLAPADPIRGPRSGDRTGLGMIADMNLSAIYRITDVWGLRVGYNLLWLTGVALAADQWDFSASDAPEVGTAVRGTGSVFLSGANAGFEARW